MKVSVIIPIYKVEKYIIRCLQSIINQTYTDIECILVNDATPDNSFIIAKDFIESHISNNTFILLAHETNKGLSEARNTGIRRSTGDYIFFLDSDDALPEDAISILARTAQSNHYPDVVYGRTIGIDLLGEKRQVDSANLKSYNNNREIFIGNLNNSWTKIACNKLIKRYIFEKKNIYFTPTLLHEDELWNFELSVYIKSLVLCDYVTYFYYVGDKNSISRCKTTEKHFTDNIKILQIKSDYLSKVSEKKELALHISKQVYATYYSIIRNGFDRAFARKCKSSLKRILEKTDPIVDSTNEIPIYMKLFFLFL